MGPFVETNNLGATRMLRAFDPILRAVRVAARERLVGKVIPWR